MPYWWVRGVAVAKNRQNMVDFGEISYQSTNENDNMSLSFEKEETDSNFILKRFI